MTSGKVVTTLGYERRYNPALQFDRRDEFVAYMNEGQPTRPANILNIVAINQGKLPLTMDPPVATALGPDQFAELALDDHIVVDTRAPSAFGSGHVPGAYNIQLGSGEFEQRVGWVAPPDDPILLVLDRDDLAVRALKKLAFIGLDQRVVGYLAGGVNGWIDAGKSVSTLPQIGVHRLSERLKNGGSMEVLDVRDREEWKAGHIEGASRMNYKQLRERIDELDVAPDDPVSVICAVGGRSSTACSVLMRNGFGNVHNVTRGMAAWSAAGLPMVEG